MTYSIDLLSDASKRAEEIFFQAGNNSSRAARNRCFHAICAFNEVDLDAPASERVAAWNKIVAPFENCSTRDEVVATADIAFEDPSMIPSATLVKAPIHMDYRLRVRVAPTAFINRGCSIVDTPVADARIGERVNIGSNVTIISAGHSMTVDNTRSDRAVVAKSSSATVLGMEPVPLYCAGWRFELSVMQNFPLLLQAWALMSTLDATASSGLGAQ
ncbi:hypothetical protein BGZ61DRAFT_475347 [Ilyonectria robusta]|uniref:uncharacterized protein n=1 Tax=Ilyonectria robusta TaxID=1079257 RepID=UPI001E8EE67C|nr:uncharacterized protein BGZ61DRAFT_475347 [Ilyonectria robusta]KAH8729780.1 hypothetical protein BGZ61DRAFT_475347 [Ilyonectria robusta]